MAENKTRPTDQDVVQFLGGVEDQTRREDSLNLLTLMEETTGLPAVMWGTSIVGFGSYHYKYETGREGDTPQIGFSPRKQSMTLYLRGYVDHYAPLLAKLGKHKPGKGCLYINKLADVDLAVLRQIIRQSIDH